MAMISDGLFLNDAENRRAHNGRDKMGRGVPVLDLAAEWSE